MMDGISRATGWRVLCGAGLPALVMIGLALVLRGLLGWPGLVVWPLCGGAGFVIASLIAPALGNLNDATDAQALGGQVATLVLAPVVMMALVSWAGAALGILPTTRWLLVALVGGGCYLAWREGLFPEGQADVFLRGRRLLSAEEAGRRLAKARAKSKLGAVGQPVWGGHVLPVEAAKSHFAVVGTTGSGKTTTIMMLAKSVLLRVGRGQGHRAVFFDDKQELLPALYGLRTGAPIITLNPFDRRGFAWDIGADVSGPAIMAQVATVLASKPTDKEGAHAHEAFFNSAVCDILEGIMLAFKALDYPWMLRDLCLAVRDAERLTRLLEVNEDTRARLSYFADGQLRGNVMASLRARMHLYDPVAAAWSHTGPRRLSLRDWLTQSESILVLANNHEISAPLMNINRAIFARLSQLLLAQSRPQGLSWVFLDEVRAAEELAGLDKLLIEGRSKGVCCVLGFQDIDGLSAAYGEKIAREMLGQCKNQAYLALASATTAAWASEMIGKVEIKERQVSVGPNGTSVSHHTVERPAVMPSELMSLGLLELTGQLDGWFGTPYTGVYRQTVASARLRDLSPQPHAKVAPFRPRPESDQYLQPWTADELRRLGLAAAAPSGGPKPRRQPAERKPAGQTHLREVPEGERAATPAAREPWPEVERPAPPPPPEPEPAAGPAAVAEPVAAPPEPEPVEAPPSEDKPRPKRPFKRRPPDDSSEL